MATTRLSGGPGIGGVIQGLHGLYPQAADGTFTVDSQDVPALLAAGMSLLSTVGATATDIIPAPAAGSAGHLVASAALANGTYAIANQPDVLRPAQLQVSAGVSAITAGTATVVYTGNDGQVTTDVFSLVLAASGTLTAYLTKGVAVLTSVTVAGLVGGTSPTLEINTTATLSAAVAAGALDFSVFKATVDSSPDALPVNLAGVLGSFTPNTAPNGTHTYVFSASYVAPVI